MKSRKPILSYENPLNALFMAKSLFLSILFGLICCFSFAQISLERQVIASMGSYTTDPDLIISSTVGEVSVPTLISGSIILTQGFQQAEENEITNVDQLLEIVVDYKVFPNPTADFLYIEVESDKPTVLKLELHDLVGRNFPQLSTKLETVQQSTVKIDMKSLPEGIYLLTFQDESGINLVSHQVKKLH